MNVVSDFTHSPSELTYWMADLDLNPGIEGSIREADIFTMEKIGGGRSYTVRLEYLADTIEVTCTDCETDKEIECPSDVLLAIFYQLKDDPTMTEEAYSDFENVKVIRKVAA
jgi:hypothetical protein